MLNRVLEPEFMDTAEEARDYDSMDHAEVNHRFVDDLIAAISKSEIGGRKAGKPLHVLDLGTGTAQIPIELCRRADSMEVVAVDAAAHMLALARQNIEAAGLLERIRVQSADAKHLPFVGADFDSVVSNSIIHHLPRPILCLREALRVCRDGGFLFFRDLMRPQTDAELSRLVDLYAPPVGSSPTADHQRAMLSDSLHAALTLEEIRRLVTELGLPADSVQSTSDRHWTFTATT